MPLSSANMEQAGIPNMIPYLAGLVKPFSDQIAYKLQI
jgi:hypothetical protein